VSVEEYNITAFTAEIFEAFVANNSVASLDLPNIIFEVHALQWIEEPKRPHGSIVSKVAPPVSIKKFVMADLIICLENGKRFKSLQRHLSAKYGLIPGEV
jgi:predicted transcriptional regulator